VLIIEKDKGIKRRKKKTALKAKDKRNKDNKNKKIKDF